MSVYGWLLLTDFIDDINFAELLIQGENQSLLIKLCHAKQEGIDSEYGDLQIRHITIAQNLIVIYTK